MSEQKKSDAKLETAANVAPNGEKSANAIKNPEKSAEILSEDELDAVAGGALLICNHYSMLFE